MLLLRLPRTEGFCDETSTFITFHEATARFEHSLLAIREWEGLWEKPFFSREPLSTNELFSYFQIMCLDEVESLSERLSEDHAVRLLEYMKRRNTATKIYSLSKRQASNQQITAELIYYWMVCYNIPFACETWHINQLMALIEVCNIKNSGKGGNMTQKEAADWQRKENERRLAMFSGTK